MDIGVGHTGGKSCSMVHDKSTIPEGKPVSLPRLASCDIMCSFGLAEAKVMDFGTMMAKPIAGHIGDVNDSGTWLQDFSM